jgi:hypothetical protein
MAEPVHEPLVLSMLQEEMNTACKLYCFRRTISAVAIAGRRRLALMQTSAQLAAEARELFMKLSRFVNARQHT